MWNDILHDWNVPECNFWCHHCNCKFWTMQVSFIKVLSTNLFLSRNIHIPDCLCYSPTEEMYYVLITFCSAFTPPATSDVMSPGLVEDGIKCGGGKICYDQRCVNISSLGFPQCPIGSNGIVCSGNGVRDNICKMNGIFEVQLLQVCNNDGRCSCFVDFTGETCEIHSRMCFTV